MMMIEKCLDAPSSYVEMIQESQMNEGSSGNHQEGDEEELEGLYDEEKYADGSSGELERDDYRHRRAVQAHESFYDESSSEFD